MKFVIKDVNKIEVLTTGNVNVVHKFLKENIDPEVLPSLTALRNSLKEDIEFGRKQALYGFYINKEEKELIYMDVFFDEEVVS